MYITYVHWQGNIRCILIFLDQARFPRNIRTYVHQPTQEAEEHKMGHYVPWPLHGGQRNIIPSAPGCFNFSFGRAFFLCFFFLQQALSLSSLARLSTVQCSPRPPPCFNLFTCHDYIFNARRAPPQPRPAHPAQAAHRSPWLRSGRAPAAPLLALAAPLLRCETHTESSSSL
jgi:hypothetical protein